MFKKIWSVYKEFCQHLQQAMQSEADLYKRNSTKKRAE